MLVTHWIVRDDLDDFGIPFVACVCGKEISHPHAHARLAAHLAKANDTKPKIASERGAGAFTAPSTTTERSEGVSALR